MSVNAPKLTYDTPLLLSWTTPEACQAGLNECLSEHHGKTTDIPQAFWNDNAEFADQKKGGRKVQSKLKPLAKFLFKSLGIFQFPNRLTCMRRLVRKVYVGLRFVVGLSRHRQCRKDTIGLAFAQAVAFSCS